MKPESPRRRIVYMPVAFEEICASAENDILELGWLQVYARAN